jgi:hypothetical protein
MRNASAELFRAQRTGLESRLLSTTESHGHAWSRVRLWTSWLIFRKCSTQ